MKKITALLLALCMLLAVVPVLAEESPAGNWYMSLADVTLGYILLNEDGTAIVNVASQEDIAGTWTADGSEKEVWFEKDGTWKMSVSDITFNQLPTTVKDAFDSGEYKDWIVDDVDLIERPIYTTIYVLNCEKRGSETERELYYTSEGELYKTTPDRDTDYREFITQEYPK